MWTLATSAVERVESSTLGKQIARFIFKLNNSLDPRQRGKRRAEIPSLCRQTGELNSEQEPMVPVSVLSRAGLPTCLSQIPNYQFGTANVVFRSFFLSPSDFLFIKP